MLFIPIWNQVLANIIELGGLKQESQAGERGGEYPTEMRKQPLVELATKESPVFKIQAGAKNPQRGTWSQLPSSISKKVFPLSVNVNCLCLANI